MTEAVLASTFAPLLFKPDLHHDEGNSGSTLVSLAGVLCILIANYHQILTNTNYPSTTPNFHHDEPSSLGQTTAHFHLGTSQHQTVGSYQQQQPGYYTPNQHAPTGNFPQTTTQQATTPKSYRGTQSKMGSDLNSITLLSAASNSADTPPRMGSSPSMFSSPTSPSSVLSSSLASGSALNGSGSVENNNGGVTQGLLESLLEETCADEVHITMGFELVRGDDSWSAWQHEEEEQEHRLDSMFGPKPMDQNKLRAILNKHAIHDAKVTLHDTTSTPSGDVPLSGNAGGLISSSSSSSTSLPSGGLPTTDQHMTLHNANANLPTISTSTKQAVSSLGVSAHNNMVAASGGVVGSSISHHHQPTSTSTGIMSAEQQKTQSSSSYGFSANPYGTQTTTTGPVTGVPGAGWLAYPATDASSSSSSEDDSEDDDDPRRGKNYTLPMRGTYDVVMKGRKVAGGYYSDDTAMIYNPTTANQHTTQPNRAHTTTNSRTHYRHHENTAATSSDDEDYHNARLQQGTAVTAYNSSLLPSSASSSTAMMINTTNPTEGGQNHVHLPSSSGSGHGMQSGVLEMGLGARGATAAGGAMGTALTHVGVGSTTVVVPQSPGQYHQSSTNSTSGTRDATRQRRSRHHPAQRIRIAEKMLTRELNLELPVDLDCAYQCLLKRLARRRTKSKRPKDVSAMTLDQLREEKRSIKLELKNFDSTFAQQRGKPAEKKDKEPLRDIYGLYKSIKKHIQARERTAAAGGGGGEQPQPTAAEPTTTTTTTTATTGMTGGYAPTNPTTTNALGADNYFYGTPATVGGTGLSSSSSVVTVPQPALMMQAPVSTAVNDNWASKQPSAPPSTWQTPTTTTVNGKQPSAPPSNWQAPTTTTPSAPPAPATGSWDTATTTTTTTTNQTQHTQQHLHGSVQAKLLQQEKRDLKKKLCNYQKRFRETFGREVTTRKDREPMSAEYERYKELKNLLKDFQKDREKES
eukprot:TRINITY_DN66588_c5_g1_i1.p1 TRINITY_DN66588_c5_g1~~TRINITY_DN66588_c5_g1_i1.p1  ORF type:complete len:1131 (+),score=176.87 TRINITY_DN66588_c5_g1_i1:475-3393(+)